ncbi:MAG: holo-ACP synthase [Armatimonadota bacterium]|nr:MAG: holo-ACP synthase [Armatimonadota bacterium]
MRQALRRRPRFAERLFTAAERAYCESKADPAPRYAARFAAKEAVAKALGRWLRWHEVEITVDQSGRPRISLSGEAAELARIAGGGRLLVSLSHSHDYAVACVFLAPPQEAKGPA